MRFLFFFNLLLLTEYFQSALESFIFCFTRFVGSCKLDIYLRSYNTEYHFCPFYIITGQTAFTVSTSTCKTRRALLSKLIKQSNNFASLGLKANSTYCLGSIVLESGTSTMALSLPLVFKLPYQLWAFTAVIMVKAVWNCVNIYYSFVLLVSSGHIATMLSGLFYFVQPNKHSSFYSLFTQAKNCEQHV